MDFDIYKEIGLNVIKVLGKGSYATVYYCTDQLTAQPFAVKVTITFNQIFHKRDFTKQKLKSFRKQAQILASIEHKNIVKFISFKETDSTIYLIMEYIPGGTLKSLINQNNSKEKKFSDNQVSTVIKNILEGIQYLHKFNIIHRDLKPGMYCYNNFRKHFIG